MNDNLVGIGQLKVDQAPKNLYASGIGSCVVVCLYDNQHKIGGMAHIMLASELPGNLNSLIKTNGNTKDEKDHPAKFAGSGIDNLISEMKKFGEELQLEAKIVGGSEMFRSITKSHETVGSANIKAVKEKLMDLQIPIVAEDLGGSTGRSLIFFLNSGQIEVRKRIQ